MPSFAPRLRALTRAHAACWFGLSVWAAPARAEPAKVALSVTRSAAATNCMAPAALARSVEARLRRRVFTKEAAAELDVAVTLDQHDDGWYARITLSDARGELGTRELNTRAPHCSALDDSLALVVALLVDTPPERSTVVAPPSADSAAPKSAKPPRAAPPPANPVVQATPLQLPRDTFAPREPWQFALRAGGAGELGLFPQFSFGPALTVSARVPHGPWLRAGFGWALPQTAKSNTGRGVRLWSERAALSVCEGALPLFAGAELGFCVGQRVARLNARGLDFDQTLRVGRLYWAAFGGAELGFALGRGWRLPLSLELEIPFVRDRFVAGGTGDTLYRVAPLVGVASAAIEFAWGS